MSVAYPLPLPELDDFEVQPLDARTLATLGPEERALAEEALARISSGTLRVVTAEEVPAALAEIRRMKAGG
jgi:hypothetical protein